MPIFTDLLQKLDTIATALELNDCKKKVGLIIHMAMCTYPENLVTISPVYSEIGLQADR